MAIIDTTSPDWRKNLNDFIRDEFDGRLWLEELFEREVENPSQPFISRILDSRNVDAYDEGWRDGYTEGEQQWKDFEHEYDCPCDCSMY